jgi:hypothetical protein
MNSKMSAQTCDLTRNFQLWLCRKGGCGAARHPLRSAPISVVMSGASRLLRACPEKPALGLDPRVEPVFRNGHATTEGSGAHPDSTNRDALQQ